jgi:flagellar motor switch/type III secretory pathway protein FliN
MPASGPAIAPYPWALLDRIPREAVGAARRVRRRLERAARLSGVSRALADLLSSDVVIVAKGLSPSAEPPPFHRSIQLQTTDGALTVVIEPEAALASVVLARLLGRAPGLTDPGSELEPALRGALAALALEVARRSGASEPLRVRREPTPPANGVRLEATVLLDERPYGLVAWAGEHTRPGASDTPPTDLASLGGMPIRIPVVAAISTGLPREIASLRLGDVWLPGPGWLRGGATVEGRPLARAALERAALASPTGERGVGVGCSDDTKLVLRGDSIALGADAEAPGWRREGSVGTMPESDETLREIALEVPIVVRVEVASVTLTAREWAELRPGDVIETGARVAEPVVLRVGGREVARGELVSVDGELGVRIRELGREDRGS